MWNWIRITSRRIVRRLGQRRFESEEQHMATNTKPQVTPQQQTAELQLDPPEVQQAREILKSTPVLKRGEKIDIKTLEAEISALGTT